MQVGSRSYYPSLEGIRALAFLLVFGVHFSGPTFSLEGRPFWQYPWFICCYLSCIAVPIFFALSGYLITGVLFDTRNRTGYFRVFYLRRFFRVFPLYYLALAIAFGIGIWGGVHYLLRQYLFLFYLQNLWAPEGLYTFHPGLLLPHLWSLAVEEQFYLVWPLVVWLLPNRRSLLTFCYTAIAVVCVSRLAWPFLHLPGFFGYENTLFRADTIMLGSALALHQRGPIKSFDRLIKPSVLALVVGSVIIVWRALVAGQAIPFDNFGIIVTLPVLSVMGTAVLVLALCPGNVVHRACEWKWAVSLGKLSYGLYVFHQFFVILFLHQVMPWMGHHMSRGLARSLGTILAFVFTYLIALACYFLIEKPALNLKKRLPYGPVRIPEVRPENGKLGLQQAA